MPLFIRLPPKVSEWVTLELLATEKVARALTVKLFNTENVRAVPPIKCICAEAAPLPIVKSLQTALPLIVTVLPLEMVTLLVLVGTPVGVHMAGLVQVPLAFETLFWDFNCVNA